MPHYKTLYIVTLADGTKIELPIEKLKAVFPKVAFDVKNRLEQIRTLVPTAVDWGMDAVVTE